MKFLAYDTSSEVLSAALFDGNSLIAAKVFPSARHSESLAGFLAELLEENKISAKKIGALAVGLGPGSFTGLRVGIANAKAMAYASGWKLVGIPSPAAIAQDVEGWRGPIAVLLDGKRGILYASFYEKNDKGLREIKKPSLMGIDAVLKAVKAQTYFTGGGVLLFKEKLLESGKAFFSETSAVYPRAERIGELAWERIQKKKFTDPFKLEPLYLHPKDCNAVLPKKS